jgi:hypothetical protein
MEEQFVHIGLWYCFLPLLAGIILGLIQSILFLQHNRRAYLWWPAMTGLGVLAGTGLLLLLALVVSTIYPHPPKLINTVMSITIVSSYFGTNGFIVSLFQFWLVRQENFHWRYLGGAWLSSVAAILAAFCAIDTYSAWLSSPSQDPMIVPLQPIMFLITIPVYGIGTSLVLARLRQTTIMNSPARS